MKDIASFIALNRFGFGPAPGEGDAIAGDPRGWIAAQVAADQATPAALAGFPSSASYFADLNRARMARDEARLTEVRQAGRKTLNEEIIARAAVMIASPAPFAERMVAFWSNHFTVSSTKPGVAPTIAAYEREAIRPHIFGRFADMLVAVIRHPSMLTYLDNVYSAGENSQAGRHQRTTKGREKTLNENLAREVLELHTLGVGGGYGQGDVIELAKAISGWGHGGLRYGKNPRPVTGDFEFSPVFHEPGAKTILGRTYPEDGENEGRAVLADLARHPATARHIATKLARHFIADDPPAEAVETLTRTFLETDGDLSALSHALIGLNAVWADPLPKAKSHYELVISAHRATGQTTPRRRDILLPLREFGQVPFAAPTPAGWGDRARDWVAPEALMRRIEWIRRFSATLPATLYPDMLLEDTIGAVASAETRSWVGRAPSGDAAIAMILASPEFLRR